MPHQPFRAAPPAAIDLDHLGRQTCDDRALQAELLALFAHQARRILGDLAAAPAGAAARDRADLLHTLCGSARAVGAWEVALQAETLERQLRSAGEAAAGPLAALPALGAAVARACAAIEAPGTRRPDPQQASGPGTRR